MLIGLTGSLATGKSTVAKMFKAHGAQILNADQIAHKLIAKNGACAEVVVRAFGKRILTRGVIDRKKLGAIVFNDERMLKRLTNIVHPQVRRVLKEKIASVHKRSPNTVILMEVPLLFESGFHTMADANIVVKATRAQQLDRAVRKLCITKAQAQKRLNAQMPLREKIRLADMIIDNSKTLNQTKKQVKEIWQKVQKKKKKTK